MLVRSMFMRGLRGDFLDRVMGLPRGVEGGTGEDEQVGQTISISNRHSGSGVVLAETSERRR
jgi:hypothetical protein